MTLDIGTLTLDCLVPAGSAGHGGMLRRIEHLGRSLPHRLGQHLSALEDEASVVLIRELAVDIALDLDCAEDHNLERLSRAIVTALSRTFETGAQGVVRFSSRAEQLCQFLRDHMSGDARSLWFHQPFAGVFALPPSRALATVLAREPETGLAALELLSRFELSSLGTKLGGDVAVFAAALAARAENGEPGPSALRAMWMAAAAHGDNRPAACLAALLAFRPQTGSMPGEGAVSAALAIAALAGQRSRPRRETPQGEALPPPSGLARSLSALARQHGLSVAVQDTLRDCAREDAPLEVFYRSGTPLGGLFMLLRDLDLLPLDVLDDATDCAGLPPAQAFRTLTLCYLAGPGGAKRLLQDGVWRDVLGLPREMGAAQLLHWAGCELPQRAATLSRSRAGAAEKRPRWRDHTGMPKASSRPIAAAAGWVLARFSRRLPGFSQSSPGYLWRNVLDVRASVERDPSMALTVTIDRPPLDPVLALSGAAAWEQEFGWTSPSQVVLRRRQA